jgi:hypothetical protein
MKEIIEAVREILRELSDVLLDLHMQRKDREPCARILDRCSEELAETAGKLRGLT